MGCFDCGLIGDVVHLCCVLLVYYSSCVREGLPKAGRLAYLVRQLLKTSLRVIRLGDGVLWRPSLKSGLR